MKTLFLSLKKHPFYSKNFKKIKDEDERLILRFIEDHENLSIEDFEFKLNRLFLDKPTPKNFTYILELLSVTNSMRRPAEYYKNRHRKD